MGQEQKVIQVELDELGYLEKNNSQNLDSKTGGNVGSGNYTKYWRDMKPEMARKSVVHVCAGVVV